MAGSSRPPPWVLDAVEALLLVVDDADRVVRWNAAVERALDRTALAGTHLDDLVAGGDAARMREAAETARWTGSGETVVDVPTGGGRRVPHEFRFRTPPDGAGERRTVVAVGRDVTDRERRRERTAVLTRLLRHDARNRLTTIRGYVTEAQEELGTDGHAADPAAATDRLATVADAAAALTDAIDRMYAIQRDVVNADATPVSVRRVVDRILAAFDDDHPAATLEARVDPPSIRAATGRALGVALEELVENALCHGGEAPHVVIEATAIEDRVRVRVCDDGPGIPATDLKPIRTGEVTPLSHASGTGLWVVRWAVRSFGGDLGFDVDGGTTVTVVAPRAPDDVR